MSDEVHADIAAIQSMEAACEQFARTVFDRLPAIERQLRLASEALDDRSDDLRREVSTLHDEISSADEDDDTSWARNRVEEAEEELASVQRRIRRLAEAGAGLNAQARKVNHLATDHAIRTREFLRGAVDDLKEYFAKTTDGMSGAPGASVAASVATATAVNAPQTKSDERFDPTGSVLPAGFVWVPLDQIDRSLDRGGFENADRFTKDVTREEMARGFNALQNEILPAVAKHTTAADSFFFDRLDREAGRPHESGFQRPFDAFFGADHIYLERRKDSELLNVTNGRHRILVATQLGWTAIPAKVNLPNLNESSERHS